MKKYRENKKQMQVECMLRKDGELEMGFGLQMKIPTFWGCMCECLHTCQMFVFPSVDIQSVNKAQRGIQLILKQSPVFGIGKGSPGSTDCVGQSTLTTPRTQSPCRCGETLTQVSQEEKHTQETVATSSHLGRERFFPSLWWVYVNGKCSTGRAGSCTDPAGEGIVYYSSLRTTDALLQPSLPV